MMKQGRFLKRCTLLQIYQQMSSRPLHHEQAHKNRQLLTLRKKYDPIEPILTNPDNESPLFNTLTLNREDEDTKRTKGQLKEKQLLDDQDFFLPQTNRIYHHNTNTRHLQSYRGTNQIKGPRASLNNLCKVEVEPGQEMLQARPQSSQTKKSKGGEVFKNSSEVINQNRPGSSKSSRLFRQKGPFANDTLNSQNEETEPLIRVTSIGGRRAGTSQSKGTSRVAPTGRSRAGSSLTQRQKGGVEKIPSKIDPDFFRLFAK